jgi:hypothetical protein
VQPAREAAAAPSQPPTAAAALSILDPGGDCAPLTALFGAILHRQPLAAHVDAVKARRRVNARDGSGRSAMSIAAACGNVAAIDALVAAGGDVRLQDDAGITPLHYAVRGGSVAATRRLMGLGAATFSTALTLDTPLHCAAELGRCACECTPGDGSRRPRFALAVPLASRGKGAPCSP